MLRIPVISILLFTLAFGNTSIDYDEKEDGISRLIHNERRLIGFSAIAATIGAIAGSVSVASTVANWAAYDIDDDGAKFKITNYFEDVEIHYKGKYIAEGSTLAPPAALIRSGRENAAGGVFDDSGPGDSAGYVQYEIANPISGDSYCFTYLWSSEAASVYGSGHDGNWIVGGISQSFCPPIPLTGFLQAANALGHALTLKGYPWPPLYLMETDIDYSYIDVSSGAITSYRIMHVLEAVKDHKAIASADLKVGMSLYVETKDGDEDHPEITIDIGPYKKIFGNAYSQNYFIFSPSDSCAAGEKKELGTFSSVKDCHRACINEKGTDCHYFKVDSESSKCTWIEKRCIGHDRNVNYHTHLFNNVKYGSEYGLIENNRECTGDRKLIGQCETSDECWIACKKEDGCEYFTFGRKYTTCYMESDCGHTVQNTNYNLYGKYE